MSDSAKESKKEPDSQPTEKEAEGASEAPAPAIPKKQSKIAAGFSAFKADVIELAKGLRSSDSPTKRASLYFWSALLISLVLSIVLVRGVLKARSERAQELARLNPEVQRLEELAKKQAEDQKRISTTVELGSFEFDLKLDVDEKPSPGMLPIAQVDISVECDTKETKEYIKENLVKVQSQVFDSLMNITRSEMQSREGKRRIRRAIMVRLNAWLPKGKVEDLFFTRVVMI